MDSGSGKAAVRVAGQRAFGQRPTDQGVRKRRCPAIAAGERVQRRSTQYFARLPSKRRRTRKLSDRLPLLGVTPRTTSEGRVQATAVIPRPEPTHLPSVPPPIECLRTSSLSLWAERQSVLEPGKRESRPASQPPSSFAP